MLESGKMILPPHVKFGFVLLLILIVVQIVFMLTKYRLTKLTGLLFVGIYVLFLTYAFVQEIHCNQSCWWSLQSRDLVILTTGQTVAAFDYKRDIVATNCDISLWHRGKENKQRPQKHFMIDIVLVLSKWWVCVKGML